MKKQEGNDKRVSPPLATPENPFGIEITLRLRDNNIVVAPGLHPRSWGQYINRTSKIENFPEEESQKAIEVYKFLKAEFGDGLLTQWLREKHELTYAFVCDGNRSRRWLADFGRDLQLLVRYKNYRSLKRRLKAAESFSEGSDVMRMAARFVRAGFAVEFDVKKKIRGRPKEPDLKLTNRGNGEEVYVEITSLNASQATRDSQETFHAISGLVESAGAAADAAMAVYKPLAGDQLEKVRTRIVRVLSWHRRSGEPVKLSLPGVLDLAVAKGGDKEMLAQWCRERGLRFGCLTGPPGFDRIERTASRLRKKAHRQLPRRKPGIVVVRHERAFWLHGSLEELINKLEPTVTEFPHMVFAAIGGGLWEQAEDEVRQIGPHWYIYRAGQGFFSEKYLLLENQKRNVSISDDTLDQLRQSFIGV